VARQDRCFTFLRLDGVTAAFEKRGGKHGYLFWMLTNTRPNPATVVVRLEGGRVCCGLLCCPFKSWGAPHRWAWLAAPRGVRDPSHITLSGTGRHESTRYWDVIPGKPDHFAAPGWLVLLSSCHPTDWRIYLPLTMRNGISVQDKIGSIGQCIVVGSLCSPASCVPWIPSARISG
jgi:hypothetical protein